ncbi:MAG TPA: 3-hydroxyacyl-CoA dehydrogenase family protein, partial [Anaerolineales bacterium]|nr:3-hydroxyacyl-CoA dehydrogenase family protein [Anaerolineales bacterium]
MVRYLRRAAVIGAGTMGAAIAAQFANAGVKVLLLDVLPAELSPDEVKQNLSMEDELVRDRLARRGLDAALKSRPASFFTADQAALVEIGNLEDDFPRLTEAEWIVEAVVEDLDVKRKVMTLLDRVREESAVVTTNTSGIPVSKIAEGTSLRFRSHFLGAHFFNPPRYVRLLEIIPTTETLPEVTDWVAAFATARLGKGIVRCKDTPNFIANRLGSVAGAFALDFIMRNGYTVEEVDAVTGPLIGRPKTATFRLLDLVGLDVASTVRRNLARAIPEDAFAQRYLNSPAADGLIDGMVARGWLGGKAGQGFYKEVHENCKKVFLPIDLQTLEYRPAETVSFESVRAAKGLDSLKDRLELMLRAEDRAGDLVRALIFSSLAYSSRCIPEIADSPLPIDNAVRWGFLHDSGPFEIWDELGLATTSSMMDSAGFPAADWVRGLISSGGSRFYKIERGEKAGVFSFR